MARSSAIICALVALAIVLTVAPGTEGAVTCGTVTSSLSKCIPYITGKGPISPGCCAGVKSLNAMATTPADRQTACGCLKSLAGKINGINYAAAAGVPGKCGVSIPYTISPSTDCSKVH